MSNCGCNNTDGESTGTDEFVMVKATSKTASRCGTPSELVAGSIDCTKEDSTYDKLMADFAFPDTGSVPVLVCNGSLYSVGQWIHFVDAGASVNIVSINANELTVKGICSNGAQVFRNPNAGTIIRANDAIVAVESPDCLTDEEKQEKLTDDLSAIESICAPALTEEPSTSAIQQFVAWTKADPNNSGYKKCIKRVVGNWFENGIPFFTRLGQVAYDAATYQSVVINKATGKLSRSSIPSGGPAEGSEYTYSPVFNVLASMGTDQFDQDTWEIINDGDSRNFALNFNISAINDLSITRDFYAIIKINIGCAQTGAFRSSAELKVNGVVEGSCFNNYSSYGTSSVTLYVPINKDDLSATLDIKGASNNKAKYLLEAKLQGVMI